MPHPFSPNDFEIDESHDFNPDRIFYLQGCVHFKSDASILDVTDQVSREWNDFGNSFLKAVSRAKDDETTSPRWQIKSSGNMMRTIKTMVDAAGEKVCELNIAFVSFDNSQVKFPPGSEHSRHTIELAPVDDEGAGAGIAGMENAGKHECFIRHSVPYFWDMTQGHTGTLYKAKNQQRIEVASVVSHGFAKDAVLVTDSSEVDDLVAVATAIVILNGRDAMDH